MADDHFGDVRATQPVAADNETAALYELGVTNGASAAAGAEDGKAPLDTNYEPDGTVNRGEMAAFITRALAHTSVRPAGVSAQYDGADVRISVRDDDFQPVANVYIDTFRTDAGGADLAFRADGSCSEVSKISAVGTYVCEIDGADLITNGDGETNVTLDNGVDTGGTVVWAWTGDNEDTVDADTDLYRLDIAESEEETMAARAHIGTEFSGTKAHLGSSVLYTVQLQDADGDDVTVGMDGEKPAQFLVTYSVTAIIEDPNNAGTFIPSPQGEATRTTLPLTTDSDGKATFSVSALPDQAPTVKADKYRVDIWIQPMPDGNAPAATMFYVGNEDTARTPSGTGIVEVRAGTDTDPATPDGLVFSTEDRSLSAGGVSVKTASDFVAASARGASNRATVSVFDQYGDPVAGALVSLASDQTGITIGGDRDFAVGRDGSHTFGYERESADAATETLTATWVYTQDANGDGTADDPAEHTATDMVEWANQPDASETDQAIREFDTETNTIFAGADAAVSVVRYDSNDRFNVGAAGSESASSYAAFERALADGLNLDWTIVGSGSREVNTFTLSTS